MRSEYAANEALSVGMAYADRQRRIAERLEARQSKPWRYWGWNHKALAVAVVCFVVGTMLESTGFMGAGCFVLCFGIRPYWK